MYTCKCQNDDQILILAICQLADCLQFKHEDLSSIPKLRFTETQAL